MLKSDKRAEVDIMKNTLYDHGYGAKWTDVYVEKRERYKTSVTDFHEHDFYEINLILSGNVKALVANETVDGAGNTLVLAKPNTSHFVSCKPEVLYSSLYLVFTEDFIKSYDIQSTNLLSVFGERGAIFTTTPEQTEVCESIIGHINDEKNVLRKRFLVFYLLSYIEEISKSHQMYTKIIPEHIYEALNYIDTYYSEKIVAQELADRIHIGRTTLMTEFKKHTGKTLHEYVTNCRLRNVIKLLSEGKSEYEAAVCSGFGDASALIQCFKRTFKMTPRQYIARNNEYI